MSAVLHYFDGRGRAEIIRLTMAATKIKVLHKCKENSFSFC